MLPTHTFASVVKELVEGLENGTIYLDQADVATLASLEVVGREAALPRHPGEDDDE